MATKTVLPTGHPFPILLHDLTGGVVQKYLSKLGEVVASRMSTIPPHLLMRYLLELSHIPLLAVKSGEVWYQYPVVLFFENPTIFQRAVNALSSGSSLWDVIKVLYPEHGIEALPYMLYPAIDLYDIDTSRHVSRYRVLPPITIDQDKQALRESLEKVLSRLLGFPQGGLSVKSFPLMSC